MELQINAIKVRTKTVKHAYKAYPQSENTFSQAERKREHGIIKKINFKYDKTNK
jgi:hypothetical protein